MDLAKSEVLVKVFPGCAKELVKVTSGRVEMYLRQPAKAGLCNKRAKEILAEIYKVEQKNVILIAGSTRQQKRFVIYS